VDEGGEEEPHPHDAALDAGELGELLLRQREPAEDHVRVLAQEAAGRGGLHALPGAHDELLAHPPLEQRHLARHRRLAEGERLRRGGERAPADDLAQRRHQAHIQHARRLEPPCSIPI
jgi:hypothetical protein